jgi:hypothetical protein
MGKSGKGSDSTFALSKSGKGAKRTDESMSMSEEPTCE